MNMLIEEDVLTAQEEWATRILEDLLKSPDLKDHEIRPFVDCLFGCSGSCEGCEGTTHCGQTYDD